jgi:putative FmdB family regulatory protein
MARYDYACPACGTIDEVIHGMREQVTVLCPECATPCNRYFSPDTFPQFTEDRVRFYRNNRKDAPSERWSYALGQEMPESRRELNRLQEQKGIEFVSKRDMPDHWKMALEYKRHVDKGGERVAPEKLMPTSTKIEPGSIMKKAREKGVRFGT